MTGCLQASSFRRMVSTYTETVLGDRPGYVALAVGYRPYWNEKGNYKHREWTESRFTWPAERDKLETEIKHLVAVNDSDVYVCPAVRFTNDRRKGSALPPQVCWVDLDGSPPTSCCGSSSRRTSWRLGNPATGTPTYH